MSHARVGSAEQITLVSLNANALTIPQFIAVTRHLAVVAPFNGPRRERCEKVRKYVEKNWFSDAAPPRYGFNTGIGSLKNVRVSNADIETFQQRFVKSHSVGVGAPLDVEIVRGAMLLQANALSKGHSGVRPLLVDKLIEMLNKGLHPVVPEQGSLGASGDLAPLTHIASVLVGEDEAEVWIGRERQKLRHLKDEAGVVRFVVDGQEMAFEPLKLQGKEAISLTNATSVMLAIGLHLVVDSETALKNADIGAALSLEAMMCETAAFAEELHDLRRHKGQVDTAANLRALVKGSARMTPQAREAFFEAHTEAELQGLLPGGEAAEQRKVILAYKRQVEFEKDRVQDSYSLRCVPQVHGACKDACRYVKGVFEDEMASITDNPVIFEDDDGHFHSRSGGNFHGEPLAMAFDFLAIALAEVASIAERRMFRLLSPRMSFGLPSNLTGGRIGLNSGFMMVQYTAAQLVSENKVLCHPASVDSIPTSDNQEDHVSMGLTAARKARTILGNVQQIQAMEYLCSVQGIHLSCRAGKTSLAAFELGHGTGLAYRFLSAYDNGDGERPFAILEDDKYMHKLLREMVSLSSSGTIARQVESELELRT